MRKFRSINLLKMFFHRWIHAVRDTNNKIEDKQLKQSEFRLLEQIGLTNSPTVPTQSAIVNGLCSVDV